MQNDYPKLKFQPREHMGWIDLLRIVACLMMVLSHCCDPFVSQFDANRTEFLSGAFIGSLMRASVPLFVMMSGVLLLPVRMEVGAFYRKRVGRILVALVFWSLLLPVIYYFYIENIATTSPCIDPTGFTLQSTLQKFWTFPLNFSYSTTPLWYLYMLVGLYLIMPILSAWLEKASKREIELMLWIWGFTLLMPYIRLFAPMLGYQGNFGNLGVFGVCDWNEYGTFHYIAGFAGYLLTAYYLVKYPPMWSLRRTLCTCISVFIAGYLITALGFILTQRYFPGEFAYLEIVWYFTGINVFMMTASLFMVVQKLPVKSSKWLSKLSETTFGIYLCHFILVQAAYDFSGFLAATPPVVRIVSMAVASFCTSYLVVRLMQSWSVTRRFVK